MDGNSDLFDEDDGGISVKPRIRMSGYDWYQLTVVFGVGFMILLMLMFIVMFGLVIYLAYDAAEDEKDVLLLEARCVFNLACEEVIGNNFGPTAVDIYCGGSSVILGRCGLTSSASGISSSVLHDLLGSSDSSHHNSPISESAWYSISAWY